jgi:MerR family transcriptional regulator, heat shock protein HspR
MATDPDRPVYVISVAAELVDMHPQTLRLYERKGLISTKRSGGKTRLYSERDIEQLREIRRLTQQLGVNLAGVEEVFKLQGELDSIQIQFESEISRIEAAIEHHLDHQDGQDTTEHDEAGQPIYNDPKDRPVYVISVAAELVGMHAQTLRLYERKGLIRPGRSSGKTRLYSERDIEHLRQIRHLTQALGVNLAGVEEIMKLRFELDAAQLRFEHETERIQGQLLRQMQALPAATGDSSPLALMETNEEP